MRKVFFFLFGHDLSKRERANPRKLGVIKNLEHKFLLTPTLFTRGLLGQLDNCMKATAVSYLKKKITLKQNEPYGVLPAKFAKTDGFFQGGGRLPK